MSLVRASEETSRTVIFGSLEGRMDGCFLSASIWRSPGRIHPPPSRPSPSRFAAPRPAPPRPRRPPCCWAPLRAVPPVLINRCSLIGRLQTFSIIQFTWNCNTLVLLNKIFSVVVFDTLGSKRNIPRTLHSYLLIAPPRSVSFRHPATLHSLLGWPGLYIWLVIHFHARVLTIFACDCDYYTHRELTNRSGQGEC